MVTVLPRALVQMSMAASPVPSPLPEPVPETSRSQTSGETSRSHTSSVRFAGDAPSRYEPRAGDTPASGDPPPQYVTPRAELSLPDSLPDFREAEDSAGKQVITPEEVIYFIY